MADDMTEEQKKMLRDLSDKINPLQSEANLLHRVVGRLLLARGPARDLDNHIAVAIDLKMLDSPEGWPPCYTSSVDAAMTLTVYDGSRYNWNVGSHCDKTGDAEMGYAQVQVDRQLGISHQGTLDAATPALALCAAALENRRRVLVERIEAEWKNAGRKS